MKKNRSYHILQIPHQELTNRLKKINSQNGILDEYVIYLTLPETRQMMYSMVPVTKRGAVGKDPSPDSIAPMIAISIPYNAMLRQLYLSKHFSDHGMLSNSTNANKALLRTAKKGPENRDEFIKDLVYVDIRGMENVAAARDALLNGLTLTYGEGSTEKYVLFERSASQARTGILVLMNEKRIEALDPAIRCGLAPEQNAIISKYAAYRALLMTSGLCVDVKEIGSCLRPADMTGKAARTTASVIVVSDFTVADWQRQCRARNIDYPENLSVKVATIDYDSPNQSDSEQPHAEAVNKYNLASANPEDIAEEIFSEMLEKNIQARRDRKIAELTAAERTEEAIRRITEKYTEKVRREFAEGTYKAQKLRDKAMEAARKRIEAARKKAIKAERAQRKQKTESGVLRNICYMTKDSPCGGDKLFDGEGIVSAKLARAFTNEILRDEDRTGADSLSSFMIRMPFVKGVVHKVDFHAFFRELYGEQDVLITDAFGQEHNIKDVHLILTVSMFKMFKEYASMFPDEQSLPAELAAEQTGKPRNLRYEGYKWYWRQFHAYQHRLFICNCDEKMRRGSLQTIANYQFLSTVAAFNAPRVVMPAVAAAWTEAQSTDALIVSYLSRTKGADVCVSERTGEQLAAEEPVFSEPEDPSAAKKTDAERSALEQDAESTYSDADLLEKCPRLAYNPLFRERMSNYSLRDECSYGHLSQAGMIRYLSGDLLQFLALLADPDRPGTKTNGKTKIRVLPADGADADAMAQCRERQSAFYKEVFGKDGQLFGADNAPSYFAPGAPDISPVVIDRNPHLSRQEHVLASRLPVSADSFRARYLGELKGVVMLRVGLDRSVSRLGGADFDGDLVRLFFGDEYIRGVEAVCKSDDEIDSLPLEIPGEKAKAEPFTPEKRKLLILRASNSKIGSYSNAGFRSSLFAYTVRREPQDSSAWRKAWKAYLKYLSDSNGKPDPENETFIQRAKKDIVMLSCLTGLDIDSVKTGLKPVFSTNSLLYHIVTEFAKQQMKGSSDSAEEFGDDSAEEAWENPKTAASAGNSDSSSDPYCLECFIDFKNHIKYKYNGEPPQFRPLPGEFGVFSMVENLPMIFKPRKAAAEEKDPDVMTADSLPDETDHPSDTVPVCEWADTYRRQLWRYDKNGAAYQKKDKYVSLPKPACALRDLVLTEEESVSATPQSPALSAALLAVSGYLRYENSNFRSNQKPDHSLRKRETLRVYLMEALGAETGTRICLELDTLISELNKDMIETVMTEIIPWKNLPSGNWRMIALRRALKQKGISLSRDATKTLCGLCEFEREKRASQEKMLTALFCAPKEEFLSFLGRNKKERECCLALYAELHRQYAETNSVMSDIAGCIRPEQKTVSIWMPTDENTAETRELPEQLNAVIPDGSVKNILCSRKYWLALLYWLDYAYLVKLKDGYNTAETELKNLCESDSLKKHFPDIAAFLTYEPAQIPEIQISETGLSKQEFIQAQKAVREKKQAAQNAEKQKYLALLSKALEQLKDLSDPEKAVDLLDTKATEALAEIPAVLSSQNDIDVTKSAVSINGGPEIPMKALLLFCMMWKSQLPVSAYDTAKAALAHALGVSEEAAAVRRLLAYNQMNRKPIERLIYRLYRSTLYGMLKTDFTFTAVADDVPDFRVGYLDGAQCIAYDCMIPAQNSAADNAEQFTVFADFQTVITAKQLTKRTLKELFCKAVSLRVPAALSSGRIIAETTNLEDAAARANWQRLLSVPFRICFVSGGEKEVLYECAISILSLPPAENTEPEAEALSEQFSVQEAAVEAAVGTEPAAMNPEPSAAAARYCDIAKAPLHLSAVLHVRRNPDGTFCRGNGKMHEKMQVPLNQFIYAFRRFQRLGTDSAAPVQQDMNEGR